MDVHTVRLWLLVAREVVARVMLDPLDCIRQTSLKPFTVCMCTAHWKRRASEQSVWFEAVLCVALSYSVMPPSCPICIWMCRRPVLSCLRANQLPLNMFLSTPYCASFFLMRIYFLYFVPERIFLRFASHFASLSSHSSSLIPLSNAFCRNSSC